MIHCTFEDGNKASLRHAVADNLVIRGNEILLAKRVDKLLEGGKWGLLSGFMERDEDLEGTVRREIFEESGCEIKNLLLLGVNSRPDRPHEDRQNVAFVFICEVGEKTGMPDNESTEQKWFDFDALPPEEEIAFDHYKNIQNYLRYKKGEVQIPILD